MTTLIRDYENHLIRNGATADTLKNYVGVVEHLQQWAGAPIEDVTADQAAAFLHRPGLKQSSRNSYHRWLTAFCEWSGMPLLDGVRRPPRPAPDPRPATAEQVRLMLGACMDDEELAMVLLGCVAGLRRMEIAKFRGGDVDPFEGVLMVSGKGGKDARVPAPPALLRVAGRMPRGFWFPSPRRPGRPIAPLTVWQRMTAISERAGAGHVPPHRLRGTYATEMVRAGVPVTTVQRCMRHSQVATTAIYIRVADEDLQRATSSLPWAS